MVARIDVSGAVLPALTEELCCRVAEACYLEFMSTLEEMSAGGLRMDYQSWEAVNDAVRLSSIAAARMAWKQIAVAGGAKVVRSS